MKGLNGISLRRTMDGRFEVCSHGMFIGYVFAHEGWWTHNRAAYVFAGKHGYNTYVTQLDAIEGLTLAMGV